MPQLQVVNTTRDKPEPTGVQEFFSKLGKSYQEDRDKDEIGKILDEYKENRNNANAWEDLQLNLEKSNISPSKRLQTQDNLNKMKKTIIEQDKALNSKFNKGMLNVQERERQKTNLINAGWPEYAAEMYLDAPPGVKQTMEREHAELSGRGIRKPIDQQIPPDSNASTPTNAPQPSEGAIPNEPQISPDITINPAQEWPVPELPRNMTNSERIKWENENEKTNTKKLDEVEKKKKAYRDNGILIRSMTKVNESNKLPSGIGKALIINPETGDIRPTAQLLEQMNPETELYIKNLKQFLKGAKEFFGSRVTNFDVSSFMAQLPTLLNSEQGRRIILKQMEQVNELESIHTNELDKAIKHYGRDASYLNISKIVDNKIAEKESQLLGKIDRVVEASQELERMSKNPDKFRGSVLMETPEGKFKAVRKDLVDKYKTSKKWSVY